MNITIFTFSYFLIAISVIGYGLLFKLFQNSQEKINFGYAGIYGLFIFCFCPTNLRFFAYLTKKTISKNKF